MDYDKLIHCLKCCARVDAQNVGCDDCGLEYCGEECQQLCDTAATALSMLQVENEKLRAALKSKVDLVFQQTKELDRRNLLLREQEAELEQVKNERDSARATLYWIKLHGLKED